MPREDLLHIAPDDLAALTNRGTVKRAQRELESQEVTGELSETADGTVTVKWSDDITCTLPGGKTISDSRCTCPATELCRHVVRTVLAYQLQASKTPTSGETAPASGVGSPWNPGDIPDEELAKLFKPAALSQAKAQFEKGLLVELVKSHKPTVRFHDLACTLKFQVRGDARYVHCDCADSPPCAHVPLAVWAFRKLPADKDAAILSTHQHTLPVPVAVLDQIDDVLLEGAESGLSAAGSEWRDRLARLEVTCRDAALIWPAEVVNELIQEYERYTEHDARFSPNRFAELVGELLIRADAIRNATGAVPQLLIRGSASDHSTELGSARFIGVGCGVKVGRGQATVIAYLQDANSGSMVAVSREFPDLKEPEEPKPFWQLARTPVVKDASFAQLGAGQLLTNGGRRTTDHHLVLGRVKAVVNPQNFSWENLRPPMLGENFAEIRARLGVLPPSTLRPRRVAEDFHVCAVSKVEMATFRPDSQTVDAIVVDANGERAIMRHPFLSRGSEGAERLLARLAGAPAGLRFVAGSMRLAGDVLLVEPVALVWDGITRTVLQPWVDRLEDEPGGTPLPRAESAHTNPLEEWNHELLSAIGSLLVTGLRRADAGTQRSWQELAQRAEQLGLARLGAPVTKLATSLREKLASAMWQPQPAAHILLELAVLSRAGQEMGF
jgi:hypothetical protein